jgi:probable rRNA maturation factor
MSQTAQLFLDVQFASEMPGLPSATQFKKWIKSALHADAHLTLRVVDLEEAKYLNQEYREKPYATNVLTFALSEDPIVVADIIICAPVVKKEALEQDKSLEAHFAHLTVHGTLHAQGFDHEIPEAAELMESIEINILAKLGYQNPYDQ